MATFETREASAVFFGPRNMEGPVPFHVHKFKSSKDIVATPYQSKTKKNHRRIFDVLKGLYREHCNQIKRFKLNPEPPPPQPSRLSWAQKVNQKRELIASIFRRHHHISFAEVSRISSSSFKAVKRVYRDLQYDDTFQPYNYPNIKTPEALARIDDCVAHLQGTFKTIADIKRENPDFSRKWIARKLKRTGFRYLMLTKQPKKPLPEKTNQREIIKVISHLTQALSSPQTVVIYCDEAHFPLFQTSERRWTLGMHLDDRIYNRRTFPEAKLTVVAACDLTGFVAIQIFKRDCNSEDFLHLLQAVLERYDCTQKVTVLADQATYHTSARVLETQAGSFLHLNVPGLFRANAIENCFSFVRSEFRKRPFVETFEEEAALLVKIFFHPDNARRFEGIHKNHLRQLLLLLKQNSASLQDEDDSIMGDL